MVLPFAAIAEVNAAVKTRAEISKSITLCAAGIYVALSHMYKCRFKGCA